MKHLYICVVAALCLIGCGKPAANVSGTIEGATGEILYFEQMGLLGNELIDSVSLAGNGAFSFSIKAVEYPELYRLRVAGKNLILVIDSTEEISVQGSLAQWQNAQIEGSVESQQIQSLRASLKEQSLEVHRDSAKRIIIANPKSMVAYYALFQTKKGEPVFDILKKEDRVFYQAVATSFNTWYPKYTRSKVLSQQVLDVINQERRAHNTATMQAFIDEQENAFLEIKLKDESGKDRLLSEKKGKPCILCFSSTQMEQYKGFVFEMKEIWNAYHDKGLEIYEVYPDANRLAWEDKVAAIPWTTVRTENGLQNAVYATYNVQQLPTIFVMDKQGNIVARCHDFESVEKEVQKVL